MSKKQPLAHMTLYFRCPSCDTDVPVMWRGKDSEELCCKNCGDYGAYQIDNIIKTPIYNYSRGRGCVTTDFKSFVKHKITRLI